MGAEMRVVRKGSALFGAEMAKCKRCEQRGKTWKGDDPRCAFESGEYSPDNWMCATMGALRAKVESSSFWHDDHNTAIIALNDNPRLLILNWYKDRGRTDFAKIVCGNENDALTEDLAEEYINDGHPIAINRRG